MAEVNPPDFLGAECYTFADFRQTFGGVVCEQGVTDTGDLLVTAAGGASVNVNVAAGSAWVDGVLNGAAGMYFVTNDASVAVTIAANGAGSSRVDLVIASVYDSQYIGAADSWAIEVIQGVAGGGVPAVPTSTRSGYLTLGRVTVPASGGTPSVVSNLADVIRTCGSPATGQPYVDFRATGSTSVASGIPGETVIALTNTVHNDTAYFTIGTNTITIVETGLYDIGWNLTMNPGGIGAWVGSGVTLNGTSYANLLLSHEMGDATRSYTVPSTVLGTALTAGSVLRLIGYQNVGSPVNATNGRLFARKVG